MLYTYIYIYNTIRTPQALLLSNLPTWSSSIYIFWMGLDLYCTCLGQAGLLSMSFASNEHRGASLMLLLDRFAPAVPYTVAMWQPQHDQIWFWTCWHGSLREKVTWRGQKTRGSFVWWQIRLQRLMQLDLLPFSGLLRFLVGVAFACWHWSRTPTSTISWHTWFRSVDTLELCTLCLLHSCCVPLSVLILSFLHCFELALSRGFLNYACSWVCSYPQQTL